MDVIALDDGYFPLEYKARRGKTILLGVLYDDESRSVKGVSWGFIEVDGLDATDKAIDVISALKSGDGVVLLDGVTYAGFNIVDPRRVHRVVGMPCIVVYRYPLSIERIRSALVKNFSDYSARLEVIEDVLSKKYAMETPWRTIEYTPIGIDPFEARLLLEKLQSYSPEPEPLRVADELASTLSREMIRYGVL